ncbi:protein LSM12-like isoform X2 [Halichondria panicea]|uniref:protein LSM12-like isoform X2 n=1 Tax=Halichondria panicea TaxID=6063 RepID=UPI00312B5BA6
MAVPPGGALLTCTTSRGDDLRGSVIAMDEKTKVVIIKTTDSVGDSVQIINLHHVSDLKISGHTQLTAPTNLPAINLQKVQQRLEQNVVAKRKKTESRGVNVSDEAQQLFDSLAKLYSDTRWKSSDIVILSDVRISPPYTPDSCTGSNSLLARIQKLVRKFQEDKKN